MGGGTTTWRGMGAKCKWKLDYLKSLQLQITDGFLGFFWLVENQGRHIITGC